MYWACLLLVSPTWSCVLWNALSTFMYCSISKAWYGAQHGSCCQTWHWILPELLTSEWACYYFMDAGRRCETPESETKDSYSENSQQQEHQHTCLRIPWPSRLMGKSENGSDRCCTHLSLYCSWGTLRNAQLGVGNFRKFMKNEFTAGHKITNYILKTIICIFHELLENSSYSKPALTSQITCWKHEAEECLRWRAVGQPVTQPLAATTIPLILPAWNNQGTKAA